MTRDEVLGDLCNLFSYVALKKSGHKKTADCFCSKPELPGFSFDRKVIEYIRIAVHHQLRLDGLIP